MKQIILLLTLMLTACDRKGSAVEEELKAIESEMKKSINAIVEDYSSGDEKKN